MCKRYSACGGILAAALFFSVACIAQSSRTAPDLNGQPVDPLTQSPGKIVVLVFLRQDCPISSRYAPVIQQSSDRYKRDANFFLVYPDKNESAASIRQYLTDYQYQLPALRDPDHVLVKQAHAQITPEVAGLRSKWPSCLSWPHRRLVRGVWPLTPCTHDA